MTATHTLKSYFLHKNAKMATQYVTKKKLKLVSLATAGIYGGIDLATEWIDTDKGFAARGPFKNITDVQRIATTLGGLALNMMGKGGAVGIGHDLVMSSLPLTEKTLFHAVKSLMGPTGARRGARQIIRAVTPGGYVAQPASIAPRSVSGPQIF